jgi:tight adherence protein C
LVDAKHRPQRERVVIGLIAAGWGCVVLLPFLAFVRRISAGERLQRLRPRRVRRGRLARAVHTTSTRLAANAALRTVSRVARAPARARHRRRVDDEMARQVADAVDLVGVGVAAGHTPYLAVQLGARWSPPLVARDLEAAVRACTIGQSFDDALRELGRHSPHARCLADTLRTSARLGSPAAPALGRLASELRADLRRRAEARARTVPVRLCFPLVGCILPAFALLTVIPAVVAGIGR